MSDWDELVESARKALAAMVASGDGMADRIEELESKLSLRTVLHAECASLLEAAEAKLVNVADRSEQVSAVNEELGGNLAKAVEALSGASNHLRTIAGMDLMGASAAAWNAAREIEVTLAELTGQDRTER